MKVVNRNWYLLTSVVNQWLIDQQSGRLFTTTSWETFFECIAQDHQRYCVDITKKEKANLPKTRQPQHHLVFFNFHVISKFTWNKQSTHLVSWTFCLVRFTKYRGHMAGRGARILIRWFKAMGIDLWTNHHSPTPSMLANSLNHKCVVGYSWYHC